VSTSSRPDLSPALRLVLLSAGIVINVAGLRFASTLLVPFALALFVTAVSLPLLSRFVQRGFPSGLAVLAVLVLDIVALLSVVSLLVRSLAEMGAAIPTYMEQLTGVEASLLHWLARRGMEIEAIPYMDLIPSEHLLGLATTFLRGATDVMSTAFLVALITVFLLLESTHFRVKLHLALGKSGEDLDWFATVLTEVQEYLALKTVISAATGLLIGLAAWLLGVDFALLWGLLAFFLNFIPNVGSILAAVPAVLVALLQHGIGTALGLAGVFLAVNMLVGNLIEPAIFGRRLGLSTLVVVLSLVFWGWVWGPVGMFLSVPLAMVTKIVLDHTSGYRWIAVLMAGKPEASIPVSEPLPRADPTGAEP
jgi:AI-2 transport protein TqsA